MNLTTNYLLNIFQRLDLPPRDLDLYGVTHYVHKKSKSEQVDTSLGVLFRSLARSSLIYVS